MQRLTNSVVPGVVGGRSEARAAVVQVSGGDDDLAGAIGAVAHKAIFLEPVHDAGRAGVADTQAALEHRGGDAGVLLREGLCLLVHGVGVLSLFDLLQRFFQQVVVHLRGVHRALLRPEGHEPVDLGI